jgi:putative Holliday junction resolvase
MLHYDHAMRYLAVDFGDKRTGLALADSQTRIATPLGIVEVSALDRAGEPLIAGIIANALKHTELTPGKTTLVVGMPFNMDGSLGPRAKATRALAEKLAHATKLPVVFQDERLTSDEADRRLARSGLTHGQKKTRRDALAAAALLEDFLRSQPSGFSHVE